MSIEGMALAWRKLEPLIEDFYEEARAPLVEGRAGGGPSYGQLQGMEEEAAGLSGQIRIEAEDPLAEPGDDYETAAELLLAAAAIDAQLAADFAILRPRDGEAPLRAQLGGGERWVTEGEEAIAQASALFEQKIDDGLPSIGGGAPRPRSRKALAGDACDAVEELMDLAEPPVAWWVKGFRAAMAPAIGEILASRDVRRVVDEIRVSHDEIFRRGSKLLREFVRKILELFAGGMARRRDARGDERSLRRSPSARVGVRSGGIKGLCERTDRWGGEIDLVCHRRAAGRPQQAAQRL